jgi:hypothetical protein
MRAWGALRLPISVLAGLSAQRSIFVLTGIFKHEGAWADEVRACGDRGSLCRACEMGG